MTLHKNFIINAALCCLLLGVVMWVSTPQVAAQNLQDVIPDDNLEIVINKALGRSAPYNQPVSWSDLSNMNFTELNASGYGKADSEKIRDLRGLGYAVWLRDLDLSHNDIEVLLLSSITLQLEILNLSNNKIANLSELSGITTLQELNLSSNRITDISALSNLTNLTHLSLANNSLTDSMTRNNGPDGTPRTDDDYFTGPTDATAVLRHLSGLTNLQELNVSHNEIVNINVVENMTALTGLAILNNNISDFSPLRRNQGLGSGDKVYIGGNNFPVRVGAESGPDYYAGFYQLIAWPLMQSGVKLYSTLGEIVEIPDSQFRRRLQYAALGYLITGNDALTRIADRAREVAREVAGALFTDNVVILHTSGDYWRKIISREPLTKELLAQIRALEIAFDWENDSDTYIHLAGLKYCTELQTLVIKDFEVDPRSYLELAALTNLRALEIDNDVTFIDSGHTYEVLEGTRLVEFDSAVWTLRNLRNLRWLKLTNLAMPDISPLAELTALEGLDISNNQIDNIQPLEKLTNLRALYLSPQYPSQFILTDLLDLSGGRVFSHSNSDLATLRKLANGIEHRWVTDTLIVKSFGLANEPLAYTPGSYMSLDVTFHGKIGAKPNATGEKPYLMMTFGDEIARKAEWVLETYNAENNSTTVEFVHQFHAGDSLDEVIIQSLRMVVPDESAVINWLPSVVVNDGNRFELRKMSVIPTIGALPTRGYNVREVTLAEMLDGLSDEAYEILGVHRDQFRKLEDLPLEGSPIIRTQPTVQMRRAGGETGTATGEKFDVEITFSGPLDEPSAAALASKISLEENVEGGSLSVPQSVRACQQFMNRRRGRCLSS